MDEEKRKRCLDLAARLEHIVEMYGMPSPAQYWSHEDLELMLEALRAKQADDEAKQGGQ